MYGIYKQHRKKPCLVCKTIAGKKGAKLYAQHLEELTGEKHWVHKLNDKEEIEEAIKAMDCATSGGEVDSPPDCCTSVFDIAKEALDRQMPKKINIKRARNSSILAHCPVCDEEIRYELWKVLARQIPYCYECGQKLDWSEVPRV